MYWFLGKTNAVTKNVTASSSFHWAFITKCKVIWYGIVLQSVWVSCPSWVPSQPTHWRGSLRDRAGFDAVQALFSNS